jgi:hypothetical protein
MLQYRSSDHLVIAATHGRGMYATDYFTLLNMCTPNLNLTGTIAKGMYMAKDFITSTGTIDPGVKVIYQAGSYIDLKPGFQASAGSDFWALIQECGIGPKPLNEPQPIANDRQDGPQTAGPLQLRCFPNPATYSLEADYSLPDDGIFSLYVRNLQGQLMSIVEDQSVGTSGQHHARIDAGNYPTGIYVLTLQTSKGAVAERFVVIK